MHHEFPRSLIEVEYLVTDTLILRLFVFIYLFKNKRVLVTCFLTYGKSNIVTLIYEEDMKHIHAFRYCCLIHCSVFSVLFLIFCFKPAK